MKNINILFIVEGEKAEPRLIKQYFNSYRDLGLKDNFKIHSVKTNIYSLYNEIKKEDFFLNIKDILIQKSNDATQIEILKEDFLYTYLIFDCDAHNSQKHSNLSLRERVMQNFSILQEMADYFDDESDPTKGRLYINYPMIESYRDCDDFFDNNYKDEVVSVDDLSNYKKLVGRKKLCNIKNLSNYTANDFNSLTKMNLFKLNMLLNNEWKSCDYYEYSKKSDCFNIVNNEKNYCDLNNSIFVLNTFLFWLVDYYGNRNGFYDKIIKEQNQ